MSNIKLEVGKTYRSREGKEVRIVSKGNAEGFPFQGSDGECYTENGRYNACAAAHRNNLIAEVPSEPRYAFITPDNMKNRYTFTIPEGTKGINVSKEGNRIIVEMVPDKTPKPGDLMVNKHGGVYIFKEAMNDSQHKCYVWLGANEWLLTDRWCQPGRPATPEEAQLLFDALKKAGKRWNPETMQVEEIPEIDRIREWVERHLEDGHYNQEGIAEVIGHYLKHKEGKK